MKLRDLWGTIAENGRSFSLYHEKYFFTQNRLHKKMQKGYDDAMQGRVKPIDQAFADIKKRFA